MLAVLFLWTGSSSGDVFFVLLFCLGSFTIAARARDLELLVVFFLLRFGFIMLISKWWSVSRPRSHMEILF